MIRSFRLRLGVGFSLVGVGIRLVAVAAENEVPPSTSSYAGGFRGDHIALRLQLATSNSPSQNYRGTLTVEGRDLPISGSVGETGLDGSFESDGERYSFRARLDGDELVFVSDGATFRLKRVAQNPLTSLASAPSGQPAAAAPTSTNSASNTPVATPSEEGVLRLKRHSVVDEGSMIGGVAATLLIPADWSVKGGVVWRLHPTMPAGLAMQVSSPDRLEALESFLSLPFSWGGYLGPGTAFPEGANYMGNEVRRPMFDAVQCLRQVVLPRHRGNYGVQVVKSEYLPRLAEAVRAENPQQGGIKVTVSAAKLRLAYVLEGKPVEEDLYCALIVTELPVGNLVIWMADRLLATRAPKGQLDSRQKLFETMVQSVKVDLNWFSRYTQLVQAIIQAKMQEIRNTGELSRMISRTQNEISETMRSAYENRQASEDRISRNFSQYIRGVEDYANPSDHRTVELPSGYREAWVGANGEYIVSDRLDFDPNLGSNQNWQRLERKDTH